MSRTLLNDSKHFDIFYTHEFHIVVHILNKAKIKIGDNMTAYELWKGKPTTVEHFRIFGS